MRILRPSRVGVRWSLGIALCTFAGLLAVVASLNRVSLLPPGLQARNLEIAAATLHVRVDRPRGDIIDQRATADDVAALSRRTVLLGRLMVGEPVIDRMARRTGIPAQSIAGTLQYEQNIPVQMRDPESEIRAAAIAAAQAPYQLAVQPRPNLPLLDIYAQAPTVAEAQTLADAAVPALREELAAEAVAHGVDPAQQVRIEPMGRAGGGIVNRTAKLEIAGMSFLIAFALSAAALLLAPAVRRGWRDETTAGDDTDVAPASEAPRGGGVHRPVWASAPIGGVARGMFATAPAATTAGAGAVAVPGLFSRRAMDRLADTRSRVAIRATDDWPHTTRILPWLIAAFAAVLWLVPFNTITLPSSLPVELKFDRLVLPLVIGAWVIALAAGGRAAPRTRLTWVHVGVGVFLAFAWLSIVLDAPYLNHVLALDRGVKRLTLLASYFTFFVIVASAVRPTEVPAFLKYSLILAVLCALGTLWEYRFHHNVFYDMAAKMLPGKFVVGSAESAGVDDLGRRLVRGPAEVPLETVAMLTVALPIALVGIMDAKRWGKRMLYALAACLLLAAMISTYRKSALFGPVAVFVTLGYFRRRQLLKLAPLGVVLLGAVKVLAPGALGGIALQLNSSRLGVSTVSDRTSDYGAVRPDVWMHLPFGEGFGTYTARILDNELLGRLVEGGVLGLAAYILMMLSVLALARAPIRRHDRRAGSVALAAAAAAVGVLVLSSLFDFMAFPHGPYLFLCLAGLLVAALNHRERPDGEGFLVASLDGDDSRLVRQATGSGDRPRSDAWRS